MEKVDGVGFARNVEIIEIAEEFRRAFTREAESATGTSRGFLIDWFKHLESGRYAFTLLIKNESAVFHTTRGKKSHIAVP